MYMITSQPTGPRIMMYSQDGFGLGHMRRTSSIASQIARQRADAAILTLEDSRLGHFFETSQNHDYLKLPSILKAGPGDWRAVNLPLPFAEVHVMRREMIRSAVLSYQPHLLLVDHMPHGAMGELLPTLEALKQTGAHTQVVLGLRDILDAPEVVRHRWQVEGAYEAIERYYDMVLVYGRREVFDMAEQYGFTPAVSERLRYCGYVCTPNIARYTARARAKYLAGASPDTRLIVAMAGGGADAYPMMRTLLDALPAVLEHQRCVLALITGPFMPAELRRNLQASARGLPAQVSMSVNDTLSYIDAADLVVAMAGYNTTMEILRSGRRALLIPRAGPSAEQRTRARLFAARGWVEMVDPDDLQAATVAQAILDTLSRSAPAAHHDRPDLRGLTSATDQLLALLPPPAEEDLSVPLAITGLKPAPASLTV